MYFSRVRLKIIPLLGLMAIASCSSERPETPEYFKELTGLEICRSAKISNVPDNFVTGSVYNQPNWGQKRYVVKIHASPECISKIVVDLEGAGNNKCDRNHCGWWIDRGIFVNMKKFGQESIALDFVFTS